MAETTPSERPKVPLRRILGLARPVRGLLVLATIALLVSAAMNLAFPWVIKQIVDTVSSDGAMERLNHAALLLVIVFAVQAIFGMGRAWLFTVAGERVVAKLRTDLFAKLLGQEMAFFDKQRTGELTNRLAADTTVLQNTVTVNLSMALRFGVGVVGGVVMLIVMSPALTGIALAVVPVVAIGASLYGRVLRKLSRKVQDALARSTEVAEEGLSSVRTVRAFAAEEREVARYSEAVEESYELAAKRAFAYGVFQGITGFAGYGAIALVVWFGGRMVLDGSMTVGDLTAFLLYTLNVAVSLATLAGLWGDFMKAAGASERVFELMDMDTGLEGTGEPAPATFGGDVVLDGVHFSYPTRTDHPVLQGMDLHMKPGEVVALVGPSGAGKSTVAQLMLRLYDPQQGQVLVDGRPLHELEPTSWRAHVGTVQQEPVLFATTIAENIRYGRPDATDEEIREAAKAANAHDFIEGFPEGYATEVGERGVRLSGGQKQRVAIARAILADPTLLILDEATSALDVHNEHLVQQALDRLMQGRTTLVIAHRLSTIQGADRVAVLADGKVVEEGPHGVLLAQGGAYARLVEKQFQGEAAAS